MEIEIELKFFVFLDFLIILCVKIFEIKVFQYSCWELGNMYFDIFDNWLCQYDIGLCICCFDEVYVQMVKIVGCVVAGLYQCLEFNVEYYSNEFDFLLYFVDIWL